MKPTRKNLFAEVKLREAQELVGELRDGDGIDPREEAKRRLRERRENRPGPGHGAHRQEQFLTQVQEAIDAALQSAAAPLLNRLMVQEVVRQGGSLLVVVKPPGNEPTVDLTEAIQVIEHATPMLRREVAAAITRKDTPNLNFIVLPAGAQKVEE
jgi:ribosome-binding factor A